MYDTERTLRKCCKIDTINPENRSWGWCGKIYVFGGYIDMLTLNGNTIGSPKQNRILCLCWTSYVAAYLLRLNFSVAIPLLVLGQGYTNTQMGMLSGLYFLTYTCGQLLNGMLGDHLDSKKFLVSGLTLSMICNIGCGLSRDLTVLGICWIVNGYAQSMLWGPIIRTLSLWFEPEKNGRVSFCMGLCTVVGYGAAWTVASVMGEFVGWRAVFLAPAAPVLVMVLVLLAKFQSSPQQGKDSQDIGGTNRDSNDKEPERFKVAFGKYLLVTHMPILLVMAVCLGIIREGISSWLPTLLKQSKAFPDSVVWLVPLIIPIVSLLGLLAIQKVIRRMNSDTGKALIRIFPVLGVLSALLCLLSGVHIWYVLMIMVLLMAVTQGTTQIFSSLVPFQLASWGHVSKTAGILDFSIYCGAAVSTSVIGMLLDKYSWNAVYLFWLFAAVTGVLSAAGWLFTKNVKIGGQA